MIEQESNKRSANLPWLVAACLAVVFMASALAQEEPVVEDPLPDEELQILHEDPQMPGTIEGTGTYFEVTDSNYLNITLSSSEPVNLTLESVPQMVVMDIEAAEGAASTQITLTGFEPSTTYYKYEDDYHNEVAFTTDSSGSYTYAQDLTIPHHVFVQPQPGTYFLEPSAGKIPPIGTWDNSTRIFTLNTDVDQTIQIDEDNLSLDGAGHTITGSATGYGVYLWHRTAVNIKDLNVEKFAVGIGIEYYCSSIVVSNNTASSNTHCGICLYRSTYNTLTDNTVLKNGVGIGVHTFSSNNTLTANTVTSNSKYGIYLSYSSNNTLTGSVVNSNGKYGIYLRHSSDNSLTGNTVNSNGSCGIYLRDDSSYNILAANTASNNENGIRLDYGSNSILTDNTVNSNNSYGIYHNRSGASTLTGNTMSDNQYNFLVFGRTDLEFDNEIDTTNLVDGKPIYYLKNTYNLEFDDTTDVGTFYLINCGNITIKDLTLTNNWAGVFLWATNNSTIENVVASNNVHGIYLWHSSDNSLTGNTVNSNGGYGIYLRDDSSYNILAGNTVSNNNNGIRLYYSGNNTLTGNAVISNSYVGIYLWKYCSYNVLTGNTASSNGGYGIYLYYCSSNEIYNNNFIDNRTQAYVEGGSGNVFNLPAPTGGNYWSNWCPPLHPDNNNDGFVDEPYEFDYGGVDYLPWAHPDGWANQPPEVTITAPASGCVVSVTDEILLDGTIADPDIGDTHTAVWTLSAEGWSEQYDGTVTDDSVSDWFQFPHAGVYSIKLTVTDDAGASDEATTVNDDPESPAFVVIYNPDGGFVTGGGWVYSDAGSLITDLDAQGKASFGFVAKYKKGATVPHGNTEFRFQAGDFRFKSSSYEWLVVAGRKAMFKGQGSIDGMGEGFKFMLTAVDDQRDKFRIKIWDPTTDEVIYDNKRGEDDDAEPTIIGGGSIVIHNK